MPRRNNTKAKIAKVAWRLFHEKGYDATTIDDIIEQSGTSKGSFYHYYSGKDALLATLPEIFDAKYEEAIGTLDTEMNRQSACTIIANGSTAFTPSPTGPPSMPLPPPRATVDSIGHNS